jgi:hypothetical protein
MDAQLIVALMASGGGGAALLALVTGIIKWLSGASARERLRNADLETQRLIAIEERTKAEKERDEADTKRRIALEYASQLRGQLLQNGITPGAWPADQTVPHIPPQEMKEIRNDRYKRSTAEEGTVQ